MNSVWLLSGSGSFTCSMSWDHQLATDTLRHSWVQPLTFDWQLKTSTEVSHLQQLLWRLYSCAHTGHDTKREEAVPHRISSSCRWSPLFKERWGGCLSIWRSVWHSRESPQVAAKLANHNPPNVFPPAFTCLAHSEIHDFTPCTPTRSQVHADTHTHTCHSVDLSISSSLVCGNKAVGATEMMRLKILLSSTRDFCVQVRGKVI